MLSECPVHHIRNQPINVDVNLKGHIEELKQKCETTDRKIEVIGESTRKGRDKRAIKNF